jgi:hypothetical protein
MALLRATRLAILKRRAASGVRNPPARARAARKSFSYIVTQGNNNSTILIEGMRETRVSSREFIMMHYMLLFEIM